MQCSVCHACLSRFNRVCVCMCVYVCVAESYDDWLLLTRALALNSNLLFGCVFLSAAHSFKMLRPMVLGLFLQSHRFAPFAVQVEKYLLVIIGRSKDDHLLQGAGKKKDFF